MESINKMIGLLEGLTGKKVILNEEYGGGPFKLPSDHKAGMKVPKGGSSCASCKFHSKEDNTCGNEYWVAWNKGNNKIPAPADEYCSDWYEPNK